MCQSIIHHRFDCGTDCLPRGMEMRRYAFPRKFFCPRRKKRRIMIGEMVFPIAPWNRFNHNTLTLRTTDPTHRIVEENTQSPHRDELKQTFRQCIIAGRCCSADTANRFAIGSSLYFHDNGIFLFVKFRFPDTKAFEFQTVVEYSFQAHGSS